MAKRQPSPTELDVAPLRIRQVTIDLEGITPYLSHRKAPDWADGGDKTKTIEEKVESCRYRLDPPRDNCTDGIPAAAFVRAMVSSARHNAADKTPMTKLRGAFFLAAGADNLVPLHAAEPVTKQDSGVNSSSRGSVAVNIYRPQFWPWKVSLEVQYNADLITPQQLYMMLQVAGFSIGVGDARPEKCPGIGAGRFRVTGMRDDAEVDVFGMVPAIAAG